MFYYCHRNITNIYILKIIGDIFIAPYSARYLVYDALQYYYPRLRPVPIWHTSQLPWEHTPQAVIIGAKR